MNSFVTSRVVDFSKNFLQTTTAIVMQLFAKQ